MKLYGVIVSAPREEDRYFAVMGRDERAAKAEALDRVDYELCSVRVVPLEQLMSQFDGCIELGGY